MGGKAADRVRNRGSMWRKHLDYIAEVINREVGSSYGILLYIWD